MKKSIIVFIIITIIIFIIVILRKCEYNNYLNKGEELIILVEKYKQNTGKLPESVSELGIKETMGEGPYYEKKDTSYIIYFNIGFDKSLIYDSNNKKWQYEP